MLTEVLQLLVEAPRQFSWVMCHVRPLKLLVHNELEVEFVVGGCQHCHCIVQMTCIVLALVYLMVSISEAASGWVGRLIAVSK